MMDILVTIIFFILMVISVGTIFVGLPGVLITAILIMLNTLYSQAVPMWLVILIFIVAAAVELMDVFAVAIGAKKFGGTKAGMIGAIIGSFAGILTGNLFLFVLGPLLGATIAELIISKQSFRKSFKAGVGTFLGYLSSIFMKVMVAIVIIVAWMIALVF